MDLLAPARYTFNFTKEVLTKDVHNGLLGASISLIAKRNLEFNKTTSLIYQSLIGVGLLSSWININKSKIQLSFFSRTFVIVDRLLHCEIRYLLFGQGLKRANDLPYICNLDPKIKVLLGMTSLVGYTYYNTKITHRALS